MQNQMLDGSVSIKPYFIAGTTTKIEQTVTVGKTTFLINFSSPYYKKSLGKFKINKL
jgi:hypothetical protein